MQNKFDIDWKELEEVIAYGLGQVGKKYIELFSKMFRIKYIVDNGNKHPIQYHGIPVISLSQMLLKRDCEKIIVFASRSSYFSIRKELIGKGLLEYVDFCKMDDFIKDWYWQFENKNCLREVHISVNTNCTFKCKNCNMFMPYYKHSVQYKLEDIKSDMNLFFSRIDYVFVFSFLGGEPFLNSELGSMIESLYQNYYEKMGKIEIITNGSVLPDTDTLKILKNCHVTVRISDYTSRIPYKGKLDEICRVLEIYKIEYCIETNLWWTDFCFPETKIEINNPKEHMLCCAPEFHGLNDGKFYYCHVAWSAEKAGLFQLKEDDYINLRLIDSSSKMDCRKIIDHASGDIKSGYISLCEKCMGCGTDNEKQVVVGEQVVD